MQCPGYLGTSRIEFLQKLWSPQKEEGMCDTLDHQARAVMEDEIRYLGVKVPETGYEISVVGERKAISWEMLGAATEDDPELSVIRESIETGDHFKIAELGDRFPKYKGVIDKLSSVDGVVVYKGRAVVPTSLRDMVLEVLHSAHQGVSGMFRRAEACVYWPGMVEAITKTRAKCESCHRVAPSQPAPKTDTSTAARVPV